MSAAHAPMVAVAVLAAHGGPRLERALASVTWADERVVLDPIGRIDPGTLGPGVRHARDAGALATDARALWLLLLSEDEVVPPALAAEIVSVTATPSAIAAYRVPLELCAFGTRLRVRSRPLRLVRRADARLELGPSLSLALAAPAGAVRALRASLRVEPAGSLGQAVDDLDGEGTVVAALLDAAGVQPRIRYLVFGALAAGVRAFSGRASPGLGWGRWIVTVLAGYRAVVAYAKLWELRRGQVPVSP